MNKKANFLKVEEKNVQLTDGNWVGVVFGEWERIIWERRGRKQGDESQLCYHHHL